MSAQLHDWTPAEYHRDPCPVASLSASIATLITSKSPRHAYHAHPRLGAGGGTKPTASTDGGSLLHELVLGAGGGIRVIEAEDYRTKAAREARDEARIAGLLPVLAHEHDEAQTVAGEIRKVLATEYGIHLRGKSEQAITWGEPVPGESAPVLCRGLMDNVDIGARSATVFDLKTIRSAHPKKCESHMIEYGYAIQWAAYHSALLKLRPDLAGRIDFVFLFCETEPPYVCTPLRPSGEMRMFGLQRWERAVRTWAECMRTGKWPGYVAKIEEAHPPPWALSQEFDLAESAA